MEVSQKNTLRQRIVEFARVTGNVNVIEAQHGIEIVDARNVVILNIRLNGVADVSAKQMYEPRCGKVALHSRRTNVDAGFKILTVQAGIALTGHDAKWRGILAFAIERVAHRDFRAEGPAVDGKWQRKMRIDIDARNSAGFERCRVQGICGFGAR